MKKFLSVLSFLSVLALIVVNYSCGVNPPGSTTEENDETTPDDELIKSTLSLADPQVGIAVDPYLVGATFCEDKNLNNSCDDGEQVSSKSDGEGRFRFDNSLTAGSKVILNTSGLHVGITFQGMMDASLSSSPTQAFVVSPLTTLMANGWSKADILEVLATAGLTDLTEDDLTMDPMDNIDSQDFSNFSTTDIERLIAGMAIQAFVQITAGVINKNDFRLDPQTFQLGTHVDAQGVTWNSQDLVNRMVASMQGGLSSSVISAVNTAFNAAKSSAPCTIPSMTAGVFIRASVAINRFVIPKVINDLTYAPSAVDSALWANSLGMRYYFHLNRKDSCILQGWKYGPLKSFVSDATELSDCKAHDLQEDSSGTVSAYCVKS